MCERWSRNACIAYNVYFIFLKKRIQCFSPKDSTLKIETNSFIHHINMHVQIHSSQNSNVKHLLEKANIQLYFQMYDLHPLSLALAIYHKSHRDDPKIHTCKTMLAKSDFEKVHSGIHAIFTIEMRTVLNFVPTWYEVLSQGNYQNLLYSCM